MMHLFPTSSHPDVEDLQSSEASFGCSYGTGEMDWATYEHPCPSCAFGGFWKMHPQKLEYPLLSDLNCEWACDEIHEQQPHKLIWRYWQPQILSMSQDLVWFPCQKVASKYTKYAWLLAFICFGSVADQSTSFTQCETFQWLRTKTCSEKIELMTSRDGF